MFSHLTVDKMVDTSGNYFIWLHVLFWDINFYDLPDRLA